MRITAFLRSAWTWVAVALLILFWTPLLGGIRLFDRHPSRLRTGRWFRRLGRALSRVQPWRLHLAGLEHVAPGQTYVIVSNHQSLGDIPLLTHLRLDTKWLAKAELFRVPLVGWMLRMAGDVPVERSDRRKAAQALLQCARYLRGGCSVVFFPEGTRSPDGEVGEFNDGPFQLALREKVPVLPAVVEGTGDALPRHSWLFAAASDVYLTVLPPVSVTGWDVKASSTLREVVRQSIIEELQRVRGREKKPAADSLYVAQEAPQPDSSEPDGNRS